MRRAAMLTALLLGTAAPALAQDDDQFTTSDGNGGFIAIFSSGTHVIAQYQAPADFAGAITVGFRGDPAAGCAAAGVCGVTGTVTWRPRDSGTFLATRVRTRRGLGWATSISLGGGFFDDRPPGTAIVERTRPDGTTAGCIDHTEPQTFLSFGARGDRLRIGAAGPDGALFGMTSRCGGPVLADVLPALAARTVRRRDLSPGAIVDLRGERALAAAGYALDVRSTFRVRIGRLKRTDDDPRPSGFPGRRTRLVRVVTARYDVTRVTGSLVAVVRGAAGEACRALDSCGAEGRVTVTPRDGGDAFFFASSQRPGVRFGELRRALRLDPFGPEPAGVQLFGAATLEGSDAVADLRRPDGSTCHDDAGGGALSVYARVDGPLLRFRLASYGADPLRTRCPGPLTGQRRLASGVLPRSAFAKRDVTVALRGERRLADDGWSARTYSTIVLHLRRAGVDRESSRFG